MAALGSPPRLVSREETNLYFFSLMPIDFFCNLGIAEMAKMMDPFIRTHLIVANYPRRMSTDYFSRFDSVRHLPYCSYQKNLIKGLRATREFWYASAAPPIQPNSLYFFHEASEPLVHLLFKKRLDRVRNVLHVKVSMTTEPFTRQNGEKELAFRRSLLMSTYSLLLGQRFVRFYRLPVTDSVYLPLYKPYHHADVVLETALADSIETSRHVFGNLPHPAKFVNAIQTCNIADLDDNSVIYFLSPDYIQGVVTEAQYWDRTNRVLAALANRHRGCPLYVKLHPADDKGTLWHLTPRNWRVLPKTLSPEEIFIKERERITAVYSSCSTSSLIAAAFGIRSFVTYPLILGPSPLTGYWDRYFSPGSRNLFVVREWAELAWLGHESNSDPALEAHQRRQWEDCLRALLDGMRSRVLK